MKDGIQHVKKTTKERGVIIAVIKDVFFGITVQNTIKRLNFEPQIKTAQSLMDTVAVYDPSLVIVDLQVIEDESAWELRHSDAGNGYSGAGCCIPHKDVEGLRARAKQAGVSRVVANSQFHREMPVLIERDAKVPGEQ